MTRGAIGFRIDHQDKIAYSHSDSYPDGLGREALRFCREMVLFDTEEGDKEAVRALALVGENDKPTPEHIATARMYNVINLGVGKESVDDYYCLLREAQHDPGMYLRLGFMIDYHHFLANSLFCEWAYIINLDERVLEVYRGFQTTESEVKGRYREELEGLVQKINSERGNDIGPYYSVSLIAELPFDDLPSSDGPFEKWLVEKGYLPKQE